MQQFMRAEAYYLRKDPIIHGISLLLLLAGTALPIWLGIRFGFEMANPWEAVNSITKLSLFLYLVIPTQAAYFFTEGFESGSVIPIVASGQSRSTYCLGKYIIQLVVLLGWLLLFFGLYLGASLAGAYFSGSSIGQEGAGATLHQFLITLACNFLYLAAFAALVLLAAMIVRRTASVLVFTLLFVFGNMLLTGYIDETSAAWLQVISDHTLITMIMKFSGMYYKNSELIGLSGLEAYIPVVLVPVVIIAVCLAAAVLIFGRRDIAAI
ncbi:hypothetical protein [Paenibacillus donghaensis]|uniref:Uncharacterized protein n=1 Tax=Paenibacillus donghaensis TaxID=414771 RepID=A0A2Z2KIH4_9BACL|nr:hypothetical protein [Paenibacillus donghaensis]ASA23020.1 hypothetical protein B9T62_20745 [Paenibacillus donghaensis]